MKGTRLRLLTVVITALVLVAFIPQSGHADGGLVVGWHGMGHVTVYYSNLSTAYINTQFTYIRGLPTEVTSYITASIESPAPPPANEYIEFFVQMVPAHVVTWYYKYNTEDEIIIAEFESSLGMQTNIGGIFDKQNPQAFNWMSNSYKLTSSEPFWHDGKRYNIKKFFPNGFGYTHLGSNVPVFGDDSINFPYASTGMIVLSDDNND